MKTRGWISLIVTAVVTIGVVGKLVLYPAFKSVELVDFGRLPVMAEGRVMPLDAVARQSALFITGKQTIATSGGDIGAMQWVVLAIARPQEADSLPIFTVTHSELRSFLHITDTMGKKVSFSYLAPQWSSIAQQAYVASQLDEKDLNTFQRNLLLLRDQMWRYIQIKNSFYADSVLDINADFRFFMTLIDHNRDKFRALDAATFDDNDPEVQSLMLYIQRYQSMAQLAYFWPIQDPKISDKRAWMSTGQAILMDTMRKGGIGVSNYVDMVDALRTNDHVRFNRHVETMTQFAHTHPAGYSSWRLLAESYFLSIQPYLIALFLYVVAAILFVAAWWFWPEIWGNSGVQLVKVGFLIHSMGIVAGMLIHGRPPVTTLYSSAVVVGWVAVLGGLLLNQRIGKHIGALVGALIGFVTLIIAHQLSIAGDTFGVMQAVLDSNFWLATHVLSITVGYSASFLAGIIAVVSLIMGFKGDKADSLLARKLSDATYFMIAMTVILSFIGTVLGGIWADQSWGRFWGWDPKENGALLIVLWNLIILHARKARYVGRFGLAVMAVLGNVVTAFSWFGVNLLGIGLHAYGFTQSGVVWLTIFSGINFVLVALVLIQRSRIRLSGLSE